jgi:HEAT repeat protein
MLGIFPSLASSTIPALTLCLNDQDFQVRGHAAFALGRIGTNSPSIMLPQILSALKKETNELAKVSLIWALGQFGTNGQTAVPVLKCILELEPKTPPFSLPRLDAMSALEKIDPDAAKPFMEK